MSVLGVLEGVSATALLFVTYGLAMGGSRGAASCASCGDIRARLATAGPLPMLEDAVPDRAGGAERATGGHMEIRIFGPGCSRCKELEARTREALGVLDRDASVVKVEDIMEIAAAGALRVPAMQINGRFVLQGRVPGVRELRSILGKAFAAEAQPSGAS